MRGGLTGGKTANLVDETNDVKPNTCQRKKITKIKQDTSDREQKDKH